MKIQISGFIISLLMLATAPALAQTDTIPRTVSRELRIGVNVVRPLYTYIEPSRFGLEAVADYNIGLDYFAVAEAGYSERNLDKPSYRMEERGIFMRIGADRNFYKQFDDVIGVGARLGFSSFTRSTPFISVDDNYWGDYTGSLPDGNFFKQWAEVVLVLKTEIFTNVFLGWNLRGKVLLFDKEDENINDRYIPGFGAGDVKSAAGFDFYIYYRFPLKL